MIRPRDLEFDDMIALNSSGLCGVPLLDMMRYHKLLAGASWMVEYGNPDISEEAAFISEYSPDQKMGEKDAYPEVLF